MNRREALKTVVLLLGGSVISTPIFLQGCKSNEEERLPGDISEEDIKLLDEISETMIPETDTPGAKAANVGQFVGDMAPKLLTRKNQNSFYQGLHTIRMNFKDEFGHTFFEAESDERLHFLNELDAEIETYNQNKKDEDPEHYFRLFKELILLGFLTSEEGSTKAMRYIQTPGRYEPCIPYENGEKAWAL